MKNREQIRAAAALDFWSRTRDAAGRNDGDVVSGFPALVINNGLLATLAFCKDKKGGHAEIAKNIVEFLASPKTRILELNKSPGTSCFLDSALKTLAEGSSEQLRRATAETLAYVAFLKRFRNTP